MPTHRAVDWLPINQEDVTRAQALAERSVADLEPVIPQLLQWLKNDSWPVAGPVAKCLRKAGLTAIPAVRHALHGESAMLKRNIIRNVVAFWPVETVAYLRIELGTLVSDSQSWGADLEALRVLLMHSLIDRNAAAQWIAFKRERYTEFIAQLDELTSMMERK